ncbi:hypothetical protein DET48_103166 [Vibrio diazotrophicus]|jgi:hypothetical protein|uniref:Uncharacterized protein n=1 Tax=Vibrio diazotrophicus TaxID=685 RepID=A0A329EFN7_VIBDI|nr:hypothetical protein DET48_103166 [Vibrio diazotrophicus]
MHVEMIQPTLLGVIGRTLVFSLVAVVSVFALI